uniref:Secreted protein n=1 Tax=Heterorhabditis bacteriophora TaxID=37862 RepID=A0A1I7WF27_HETBA
MWCLVYWCRYGCNAVLPSASIVDFCACYLVDGERLYYERDKLSQLLKFCDCIKILLIYLNESLTSLSWSVEFHPL